MKILARIPNSAYGKTLEVFYSSPVDALEACIQYWDKDYGTPQQINFGSIRHDGITYYGAELMGTVTTWDLFITTYSYNDAEKYFNNPKCLQVDDFNILDVALEEYEILGTEDECRKDDFYSQYFD